MYSSWLGVLVLLTACGVEEADRGGVLQTEDLSMGGLTTHVLGANTWEQTLAADRTLNQAFGRALVGAFDRPDQFKPHYSHPNGSVGKLHVGITRRWPSPLANVFTHAASSPGPDQAWQMQQDSEGKDVCGRGPLHLTYRQAVNLGLENVQLDALVSESIVQSTDHAEKWAKLNETAVAAGRNASPDGFTLSADGQFGRLQCLHTDGPDDRDDLGKLISALDRELGPAAVGLPAEGDGQWLAYRLMKLGAMDFTTYATVEFNSTEPASQFLTGQANVGARRGDFAISYAAQIMAQAVVTRCSAVLDKDLVEAPNHLGQLPEPTHCAMLKTFVEYGGLD